MQQQLPLVVQIALEKNNLCQTDNTNDIHEKVFRGNPANNYSYNERDKENSLFGLVTFLRRFCFDLIIKEISFSGSIP